ncbi:MAG: hypothetical protein RIB52_12080 [Erythrobacter sp.]|uniref:hypothetical protein n=1 Tax=Erythrobacter sp. TaxID=1042 RepID=UPI0032EC4266
MRFKLYRCTINRTDRKAVALVVAPDEQRAREVIVESEIAFCRENEGFQLERIDQNLPPSQKIGLDALLENAPVGLASYSEAIGWVPHAMPQPKLHLWRIEIVDSDEEHHVVAPTADLASAIVCAELGLAQQGPRTIRIHDGLSGLTNEKLKGLPALLEYGEICRVEWHDQRGWRTIAT